MSNQDRSSRPIRVVVCGVTFGQIYLAGLAAARASLELTGIFARGSYNARRTAMRWGVPLFTRPSEVPADTDIVCVVVRSGAMGGNGTDIARTFLERGTHVLQEHPVHGDELASCLDVARRNKAQYRINSFYPNVDPVSAFIGTARRLLARQTAQFVDATCAIQVAYPLFDILGKALGGVRPWCLGEPLGHTAALRDATDLEFPFRTLEGVIAGVPFTLRVQNQTDPHDPDNHLHHLHRICIGTASGNLTLVNTHGPVVWSPRMHVSDETKGSLALDGDPHLDALSATILGPASSPSFREILGVLWPLAAARAVREFGDVIAAGADDRGVAQYHLALCKLWQDATARLGYPELISGDHPEPIRATDLVARDGLDGAS